MSLQESHEEIYKRVKKRLRDYRYLSGFLTLGTMAFALLFILSLFPLVPAILGAILSITYGDWVVWLWFLCIGVFGVLFWVFQRFAKKIEEKRGITLEEKMYVPAYEALCYLREYFDPDHPIIGSKLKAERRMRGILVLLGEIAFPNATIVKEEVAQLWQLSKNLRMKLIPSMRKHEGKDSNIIGNVHLSLIALVDYLSKPELPSLVALNKGMASLPEKTERSIYEDVRTTFFKRSNLRHIAAFLVTGIAAWLIYFIDLNYFGSSLHEAYALGVVSLIALVTLYVTYLGLTKRRELRT